MTTRLEAAAWLIDTTEDRLLSRKDYGIYGVVVIGPDGRKHVFTDEQVKKAILAMQTSRLADMIGKKSPRHSAGRMPGVAPTHAQAHAPKANARASKTRQKTKQKVQGKPEP